MKNTNALVIMVVLIIAALLVWLSHREPPKKIEPAKTPPAVEAAQAKETPAPTIEIIATPEATTVPANPWDPYVGHWVGEVLCHSATFRFGDELACSAELTVRVDGTLALRTERKFSSDGAIQGHFFEESPWPGNFDVRDGQVSFSHAETGMVRCVWLATEERDVAIPLRRAAP